MVGVRVSRNRSRANPPRAVTPAKVSACNSPTMANDWSKISKDDLLTLTDLFDRALMHDDGTWLSN